MTRSRYFKLIIAPVRTGAHFRPCRDTAYVHHTFDYPDCDCLRRELPVEHQAKSSGALAHPSSPAFPDNSRLTDRFLRTAATTARKSGRLGATGRRGVGK